MQNFIGNTLIHVVTYIYPVYGDDFFVDRFYMPHGLTIDKEGNLWITDVGLHQVWFPATILIMCKIYCKINLYRNIAYASIYPSNIGCFLKVMKIPKGSQEPNLTLGVRLTPGSDDVHFCKPTDVAVDSNGNFFVSDG
jgi:peptidylamidoglycolate lyase